MPTTREQLVEAIGNIPDSERTDRQRAILGSPVSQPDAPNLREIGPTPEQPAVSTGTEGTVRDQLFAARQAERDVEPSGWDKFLLEATKGPDGTIMSSFLWATIDPVEWAKRQGSPIEKGKEFAKGLASGATLGAVEADKGTAAESIGKLTGFALPVGAAAKAVSLVPKLGKAVGAVAGIVRSGATGVATGAVEQTVRSVKGEKVHPEDAFWEGVIFAGFDGFLRLAGIPLRKLVQLKDVKRIESELRAAGGLEREGGKVSLSGMTEKDIKRLAKTIASEKPGSALTDLGRKMIINERTRPTPKSMLPSAGPLLAPAVNAGEVESLMHIPVKHKRGALGEVGRGFKNPIRMHEEYGTKELMYHPIRASENQAARRYKDIEKEFTGVVRQNIKVGKRQKASERVAVFAFAQQRGGEKLLQQMGITEIPKLTGSEQNVYNYMRKNLKEMFGELQKARIASGVAPFKETPNYFTWFRSLEGEATNGTPFLAVTPLKPNRPLKFSTEATTFRFAKKRLHDNYGPVEMDAFNIFRRYMNSATKHAEMSPHIAKANELLEGEFVNGFKLMEHNPVVYQDLRSWLNFQAGIERQLLPERIEGLLRRLNRNIAFAILSYNLRSAVIQPTAMHNAATMLGPKWLAKGVRGLFDREARRFTMEHSTSLAARRHDIAITDALQGVTGTVGAIKRKLGKAGIWPLQALDHETAKATWWGAWLKANQQLKLSFKEAVNFADDIVVRTQASAARVDLAPIQTNTLGKSVSLFNTFVINNFGFLTKDIAGLGTKRALDSKSVRKIIRYVAGASMINTGFEDVLGTRSPFPAPIKEYRRGVEKGDSDALALMEGAKEVAELIPIVGGAIRYGGHPAGAVFNLLQQANDLRRGKKIDPIKAIDVGGQVLGVPGTREIVKQARRQRREKRESRPKR